MAQCINRAISVAEKRFTPIIYLRESLLLPEAGPILNFVWSLAMSGKCSRPISSVVIWNLFTNREWRSALARNLNWNVKKTKKYLFSKRTIFWNISFVIFCRNSLIRISYEKHFISRRNHRSIHTTIRVDNRVFPEIVGKAWDCKHSKWALQSQGHWFNPCKG